jgi:hypothetical protein
MLVSIRAQKPLPLGGLTGDGVHIWDADLKVVDDLLADDELIYSVAEPAPRSPHGQKDRTPPHGAQPLPAHRRPQAH